MTQDASPPSTPPGLHEAGDQIPEEVVDAHRAITSLREELEAVDWYNQRAAGTRDPELRRILEHNRDEEKEHAVMLLEWLRQRDPALDHYLKEYLFTPGAVQREVEADEAPEAHEATPPSAVPRRTVPQRGLGIGSLRRGGG